MRCSAVWRTDGDSHFASEKWVVTMRINSNRKIHKMKRDPYQRLLRLLVVLAAVAVVSAVIFLACNAAVQSDYQAKLAAVKQQNIDGQQQHDAEMNALRNSNNQEVNPQSTDPVTGELMFWEKSLENQTWRVEDEGYGQLENTSTVTVDRADLLTSGLLLVNPWHALPSDFSDSTLVSVGNSSGWKIAVDNGNVRLFPIAYEALDTMIADANAAGMQDYIVREAYRSNDDQTNYFNKQMEKLSDKYSGDILIAETKKYVNYPGTSDYQSGMSFRMGLYNKEKPEVAKQKFMETDQGKWFTNNAWKYGVIFRFPSEDFPFAGGEDKSYKTGVSAQMLLYRYVGKAHAAAMQVLDYCMEEYVEFLISHPHICIYQDGALRYEVYRVTEETQATYDLPVPNPASSYSASLDNMGGIVLTYAY